MSIEFEKEIINSLNRYLKFSCADGKNVKIIKENRLSLENIVSQSESESGINNYFFILSLFENRQKEIEDAETREKLLLIDYLKNRDCASIVRIDWEKTNPIEDLLKQVKKIEKEEKIKLIILG